MPRQYVERQELSDGTWLPLSLVLGLILSQPGTTLAADQSNQGRQLTMEPREIRTYRVRLYSVSQ